MAKGEYVRVNSALWDSETLVVTELRALLSTGFDALLVLHQWLLCTLSGNHCNFLVTELIAEAVLFSHEIIFLWCGIHGFTNHKLLQKISKEKLNLSRDRRSSSYERMEVTYIVPEAILLTHYFLLM